MPGRTQLHLSQVLNTEIKVKDDGVSSTASTEWQNKLTLPVQSNGQEWLILVYAEVNSSATNTSAGVRLQIDGVSVMNSFTPTPNNSNQYMAVSSTEFTSLQPGDHTIRLDFRSVSEQTVSIRRARIFVFDLI